VARVRRRRQAAHLRVAVLDPVARDAVVAQGILRGVRAAVRGLVACVDGAGDAVVARLGPFLAHACHADFGTVAEEPVGAVDVVLAWWAAPRARGAGGARREAAADAGRAARVGGRSGRRPTDWAIGIFAGTCRITAIAGAARRGNDD